MANGKDLRPFELLAIVLSVPSLVLGAIVLAADTWRLPGPGENSMAVVIPCGVGSIAFFALFLVVGAAARLRWRWFLGIAGVWLAMCVALYGLEELAVARQFDPQPLIVKLTRADVLYSEANQPLYLVVNDKTQSEFVGVGQVDRDATPKQIWVVGEAAMRCLAERIEHGREFGGADKDGVLSIAIVRAGSVTSGGASRRQVLLLLSALKECVDGPGRERIAELRAAIEAKVDEASGKK